MAGHVTNLSLNWLKRKRLATVPLDQAAPGQENDLGLEVPDTSPGPEALVLQAERQVRLWQEIAALPPEFRTVIELRHFQGLAYFCLLPLFFVSLPALFVVQEVLLPDLLEQSRARLARAPGRSFLMGLVNGLFFLALAGILGDSGVGLLAFIALLLLALLLAVVGFGTLAGMVDDRVFALWERPAPPGVRLLVGGLILEALLFVPVAGWLILAVPGLSGFGAVLLALWHRRRRTVKPEAA